MHYQVLSPIESANAIRELAEIINQLWGHRTPGGRLFPGPLELEPIVISWSADGQTTTVALTAGQPVTPSTVLGPGVLAGQPPGTTAATVRVSDPAVLRHVRPGDAVDVVHHADDARSSPGRTAARGVTVLWAAAAPAEQGSSVLSGGTDGDAGLVVLAAPRETATDLASLEGSGRVSLVLVSR